MEKPHKPIVNIAELAMRENAKGSRFAARAGRIGGVIGMKKLGAQYIEVPPGKAAYPLHAHRNNEELFVILEGTGTYRRGDDNWPVNTGDVIAAPAGDAKTAHQIINNSDAPLRYLAISTRNDPDIFEYPESDKFGVASGIPEGGSMQGAEFFFLGRTKSAVDYWDGEDIGEKT